MKINKPKLSTFEELKGDYPNTLFKYRIWDDIFQKTIITERVVCMSDPRLFKDPKDCKNYKRYDLMTIKDIHNHYLSLSYKDNDKYTIQQHKKFAIDWTQKSLLKDKEETKKMQEEHFNDWCNHFGVLSLTANSTNIEMWNKYSDNGKGFCIGFNSAKLFESLGGGGKIEYTTQLPDIYYDDDFDIERIKRVYYKEKKWSFEEEYRTTRSWKGSASINDRQIQIPKETYSQIILGWNISNEYKTEILNEIKLQKLNIQISKAYLNQSGMIKIKTIS